MLSNMITYSTVALSLVGATFAHTTAVVETPYTSTVSASPASSSGTATPSYVGVYDTFEDFTDDLTDCINECWADIWDFAEAVCDDDDLKCVCLIPEPNLDDPALAKEFGQITDCSVQCGEQDISILETANLKFIDTCKPYLDKYGPIAPVNHDYYLNALAQVAATATDGMTSFPSATGVPAPGNETVVSTTASGNATASVVTPTNTGVAVVTANAAVANGHWEMPLLVAFVMGVGARLL